LSIKDLFLQSRALTLVSVLIPRFLLCVCCVSWVDNSYSMCDNNSGSIKTRVVAVCLGGTDLFGNEWVCMISSSILIHTSFLCRIYYFFIFLRFDIWFFNHLYKMDWNHYTNGKSYNNFNKNWEEKIYFCNRGPYLNFCPYSPIFVVCVMCELSW